MSRRLSVLSAVVVCVGLVVLSAGLAGAFLNPTVGSSGQGLADTPAIAAVDDVPVVGAEDLALAAVGSGAVDDAAALAVTGVDSFAAIAVAVVGAGLWAVCYVVGDCSLLGSPSSSGYLAQVQEAAQTAQYVQSSCAGQINADQGYPPWSSQDFGVASSSGYFLVFNSEEQPIGFPGGWKWQDSSGLFCDPMMVYPMLYSPQQVATEPWQLRFCVEAAQWDGGGYWAPQSPEGTWSWATQAQLNWVNAACPPQWLAQGVDPAYPFSAGGVGPSPFASNDLLGNACNAASSACFYPGFNSTWTDQAMSVQGNSFVADAGDGWPTLETEAFGAPVFVGDQVEVKFRWYSGESQSVVVGVANAGGSDCFDGDVSGRSPGPPTVGWQSSAGYGAMYDTNQSAAEGSAGTWRSVDLTETIGATFQWAYQGIGVQATPLSVCIQAGLTGRDTSFAIADLQAFDLTGPKAVEVTTVPGAAVTAGPGQLGTTVPPGSGASSTNLGDVSQNVVNVGNQIVGAVTGSVSWLGRLLLSPLNGILGVLQGLPTMLMGLLVPTESPVAQVETQVASAPLLSWVTAPAGVLTGFFSGGVSALSSGSVCGPWIGYSAQSPSQDSTVTLPPGVTTLAPVGTVVTSPVHTLGTIPGFGIYLPSPNASCPGGGGVIGDLGGFRSLLRAAEVFVLSWAFVVRLSRSLPWVGQPDDLAPEVSPT